MTCKEVADFIADYLAGELPLGQVVRFKAHLAICKACVSYLASYESTIALGQAACSDEPAELSFPDELLLAILDARSKER